MSRLSEMKIRVRKSLLLSFLRYLMSPAKKFHGRRLFDESELRLAYKAFLSRNLFGIGGKLVSALEKEFARAYGVPYAVASTSGTAAPHTALGALGLNPKAHSRSVRAYFYAKLKLDMTSVIWHNL